MHGLLYVALFLTLVSCSSWKSKEVTLQEEEIKLTEPVTLKIRPGEVLRVDFSASSGNRAFKCKDKKIPYFYADGIAEAYIVETYFSDLRPFACFYGKNKVFDVVVVEKEFPSERLHVDRKKVFYSKEDLKRIRAEQKVLNKIYNGSLKRPLFKTGFELPINSKITSIYGTRRIFNNKKKSQHLGTDYRAKVGTPIYSSNAGKVVLSRDLFFTGNTIIVDHGLGLFTLYGHLSETKAEEGEFLPKGALVGLAGMTGRATGPHLHWGVKIHGEWIDGKSLVAETADEKL